ncbi:hypothetical protein EM868_09090 [Cupriavidus gilardii]|uniref:hypothetical protein n=1 Tax=Cupriavidus gilardii TaxID=82541 RepID=UPI001EE4EF22|nr:hypothetical protein [Cupriavidus gilardii]MCG5259790.1 hypothetical protein [Cupriavidus gilardii]MDF9429951.1 hypothetical protein [Cupriavidus gilardii]
MTKERPILFSGAMVRAILDGRKTQTRRVLDDRTLGHLRAAADFGEIFGLPDRGQIHPRDLVFISSFCRHGRPGDRLWVRETWAQPAVLDPGPTVYRADYPACVPAGFESVPPADEIAWKPSIHMPRVACRLVLEITGVRVERLQDISEADATAEGAEPILVPPDGGSCPYYEGFRALWDCINGAGAWEQNPWVWVVEFRRINE